MTDEKHPIDAAIERVQADLDLHDDETWNDTIARYGHDGEKVGEAVGAVVAAVATHFDVLWPSLDEHTRRMILNIGTLAFVVGSASEAARRE